MPPILLWLLSLKDPLFFCLAYTCLFEGNVASNTVRSWKILYSRNRIEQFGEYFQVQFNKGDENKISFGSTDLIVHYMDEFHWRV